MLDKWFETSALVGGQGEGHVRVTSVTVNLVLLALLGFDHHWHISF